MSDKMEVFRRMQDQYAMKQMMNNSNMGTSNRVDQLEARLKSFEKSVACTELELRVLGLFMTNILSKAEYRRLIKMLYSPDKENHTLVEEIIRTKIKEL